MPLTLILSPKGRGDLRKSEGDADNRPSPRFWGRTRGASNMPFCETNPNCMGLKIDVSIVFARCYKSGSWDENSGSFGKRSRLGGF
jgi:hypothetical protein